MVQDVILTRPLIELSLPLYDLLRDVDVLWCPSVTRSELWTLYHSPRLIIYAMRFLLVPMCTSQQHTLSSWKALMNMGRAKRIAAIYDTPAFATRQAVVLLHRSAMFCSAVINPQLPSNTTVAATAMSSSGLMDFRFAFISLLVDSVHPAPTRCSNARAPHPASSEASALEETPYVPGNRKSDDSAIFVHCSRFSFACNALTSVAVSAEIITLAC